MENALVVGAGGLLGSEVLSAYKCRGAAVPETAGVFDWDQPEVLERQVEQWAIAALHAEPRRPLSVYWCAGTSYVGSTAGDAVEASRTLAAALGGLGSASLAGVRIHLSYASSAGAVWAGARSMPVTEVSPPAVTHAYGRVKLAEEELVRRWADAPNRSSTIARIANLFGRNQKPDKNQGLLTKLVSSTITGEPTMLFVPLDTCRDYLPAATAAAMLLADSAEVLAAAPESAPRTQVRIIASEREYTIAQVCGILLRMRRRRVPVAHVVSEATRDQPTRLTFRSIRPPLGVRIPTLEESLRALFDQESRRLAMTQ